ncbi:MAG: HAD hydrolase family protein [Treponema sp.]|nr:HAD hydrolase family protein [Treponema sp.]
MNKLKVPAIGARIIKSATAILLCYVIDFLRGSSGIVFYSQIAALWCIQSYISTTKKNAIQRTIGTCIGALFGLIVLVICKYIRNQLDWAYFAKYSVCGIIISSTIVLLLWLTVLIKKKQASYFSCVVFLSIVVNHAFDANSFLFVWNRFLDTMIGIFIGCSVNLFHLPRFYRKDLLFLSGLDDTLLNSEYHLNDYCKVELNRMLDKGINFTLSTMRPPAAIMEPMAEIRLKLPVIAMDGAVLYDTQKRRYLRKIELERSEQDEVLKIFEENNVMYFANVIVDDSLFIYYKTPQNPEQQQLIDKLRLSPYRNYINRSVPADEKVVYFMLLYPMEKIEEIYSKLSVNELTERLKIIKYESRDFPGYGYIKVFNKKATKEGMIEYLKSQLNVKKTITFGTIPDRYDYVVKEGNTNEVVHTLKKLFEPYFFNKELKTT